MSTSGQPSAYRERLSVPVSYWAIALFFGLTFVTAVAFMLGELILVLSTVGVVVLIAWTLIAWGSLTITVGSEGIRVGRSLLEWGYAGEVLVAGEQLRRRVLARDDAFLALRPYAGGAVVIGVTDEADPHLCWLVSTREPDDLLRAIARNRPSGVGGSAEESRLDSGG